MLAYNLDNLGWERFEQLVQALLKARLGIGVEAWGGSGDWGRDAYFHGKLNYPTNESRDGAFVFQCKFVEAANAAGAKPEKPILGAIRKECARIKGNVGDGGKWKESPTCYAFFTNAALRPETRRKIENLLQATLTGSIVCTHDGNDMCQWLRDSPNILESFEQLNPAGNEKRRAAERRWQQIQSHPIRELKISFILKDAVGLTWFNEVLNDTLLNFDTDEPSFKVGQILASSPTPNSINESRSRVQSICSYWEIYKPEKGYWVKKIAPEARAFPTVAGLDAITQWPQIGPKSVKKLQDLGLLRGIGISFPARAFQIGIEEFVITFTGDTFSFEIRLSENGLDALHELAKVQFIALSDKELIPIGTQFGGVQLLDMFYRQVVPGQKKNASRECGGDEGGSISGGFSMGSKAISFYPKIPNHFMKSGGISEYLMPFTMPSRFDVGSRIKELEEELKSNPSDAETTAELASLYKRTGRLLDAIRCCEASIEQASATAEVYGLLAESLRNIGRCHEAITHFQAASAMKSNYAAAECGLAYCYNELKQNDEAMPHFEAAARMEPTNAMYQMNQGICLMNLKRYPEAIEAYRRSIDLDPQNANCAMWLGMLLHNERNFTDASFFLQKAAELAPECAEAHQLFGMNLATTNHHEQAIASFQRAIDLEVDAPRCELLGASLAALHRWSEAEVIFRRGADLAPSNSDMIRNLGVTLANQNRLVEAVQSFELALSINPDDSIAQQSLTGLRASMAES